MSDHLLHDLKKIGEHSIVPALLPEAPFVIDVGCRDFGFCAGILALRPKALIVALDPDPKMEKPKDVNVAFVQVAVIEDETISHLWYLERGGEANCVSYFPVEGAPVVCCTTIRKIMLAFGRTHIDLLKLDCEGSEFPILERWPGPIATQISVEFHDYNNWQKWDDAYFKALERVALKDYHVVQNARFGIGPGNDQGHWDSVFVLKNEALWNGRIPEGNR